jgi:hypothetical protein
MIGRTILLARSRGAAAAGWAALALAVPLALAAATAEAGIFRDVMEKVGLAKPGPPKTDAGGTPVFPRPGFTCCNFHYESDTVSDSNHAELPILPAGTAVTVLGYGRNRATIDVDGKTMRLDHDEGRDQESLDAWVNKLIIAQDPRPRIAGYPAAVQGAIKAGKVMLGMSREQALVAVGYPVTKTTKTLDAPVWRLWNSRRGEYQLNFGPEGTVVTITGDGEVTSQVIYLPPRK